MKNPIVQAFESIRTAVVDAAIEYACNVVERQQKGENIPLGDSTLKEDHGQEQLFESEPIGPSYLNRLSAVEAPAFIADAKKSAEEIFPTKIDEVVARVGEVQGALLIGTPVNGTATLVATKSDGTEVRWEIRQQVNVSKFGKIFLQWTMRKVK